MQELERANELQTKRDMRDQRLAMTDTLWEITRGMEVPAQISRLDISSTPVSTYSPHYLQVLHQDNWTQEVTHSLKKFEKQLIIALKEKGWDGKEDEATVTWTFAGALFYCITVITTIGKNRYF